MTASPIIVALDTTNPDQAVAWARATAPHAGMFKLGLEYFLANGAAGYRAIADMGPTARPIFLDLKLHDIPNTVAGGIRAVLNLAPRMITIHAAGGARMIAAAREAAEAAGANRPLILAVTVLTSLDDAALHAMGVPDPASVQVSRLARLAIDSGADGLVCSPLEVASLRQMLGPEVTLVVPGIRPAGADAGDQARTLTPAQAIAAGADWLVIGRPITGATDPASATAAILASLSPR